jgi:uncharacterized protein (TIGR03083 family)
MADFPTWLAAIHSSHERMTDLVADLDEEQVRTRSYADEWSIAQVASHLGSQAEIFDLFLTAGLDGAEPPDGDVFTAIWDRWNALPPAEQVRRSVAANAAFLARLTALTEPEQKSFSLSLFGTDLDIAGFASMRLGEHALHTWDIAVALDPGATLSPDAVDLLVDTFPAVAGRAGTPIPAAPPLAVETTAPPRRFAVALDPGVSVTPLDGEPAAGTPLVRLPAEALLRLIGGRLDEAHTPADVQGTEHLPQLREAFPGL